MKNDTISSTSVNPLEFFVISRFMLVLSGTRRSSAFTVYVCGCRMPGLVYWIVTVICFKFGLIVPSGFNQF